MTNPTKAARAYEQPVLLTEHTLLVAIELIESAMSCTELLRGCGLQSEGASIARTGQDGLRQAIEGCKSAIGAVAMNRAAARP